MTNRMLTLDDCDLNVPFVQYLKEFIRSWITLGKSIEGTNKDQIVR
jgi:hypothetical protein